MLEVSKPIIKDRLVAKKGDKTTFLNDGLKYSYLCKIEDKHIRKPMINIKMIGKPYTKLK